MDDTVCVICNENVNEGGVKVTKKGLASLVNASKQRIDGKHEIFERKEDIIVHKECRKSYITKQCIAAYIRSKPISEDEGTKVKNLIILCIPTYIPITYKY